MAKASLSIVQKSTWCLSNVFVKISKDGRIHLITGKWIRYLAAV